MGLMTKIQLVHTYEHIICFDNLLETWQEFIPGKHNRQDVLEFEQNLINNLISLYQDLLNKTYKHSTYQSFNISDPKPRIIHKATVRDRIVHRAIYRKLYSFFDKTLIRSAALTDRDFPILISSGPFF